jgi:hypothetical protein
MWTQGLYPEPFYWTLYCEGFFRDRVSKTICLGWLGTVILLISAPWVARIIGVSHWGPGSSVFLIALCFFFFFKLWILVVFYCIFSDVRLICKMEGRTSLGWGNEDFLSAFWDNCSSWWQREGCNFTKFLSGLETVSSCLNWEYFGVDRRVLPRS